MNKIEIEELKVYKEECYKTLEKLIKQLVKEIYGNEKEGLEKYEKFYCAITHYKNYSPERFPRWKIIVVKLNDEIIGFAGIILLKNCVYLDDIVVDEKFRGKGIGKLLIEYIKKNYGNKIIAETHSKALNFFLKLGFKVYKSKLGKDGIIWYKIKNY